MDTFTLTWRNDREIDNILRCNNCGSTSRALEIARHVYTCEVTGNPNTAIFSFCPVCKYPLLGLSFIKHFKKSSTDLSVYEAEYGFERLYPPTREGSYTFPEDIKAIFDEAIRCYESKLFTSAIIMCRKTLEAVCNHFDPSTKNLYQGLKRLCELNKIDKQQLQWADSLRKAGNFHTHETKSKDTAEQDAYTIIDFTEVIVTHIFELTERYKRDLKEIEKRSNKDAEPDQ